MWVQLATKISSHPSGLDKLATTRYEKEIAAGNISRADITPGVPQLPGFLSGASRKLTRDKLYNAPDKPLLDLERRRRINQFSYEKNPLPAVASLRDAAITYPNATPKQMEEIQRVTQDMYNKGQVQTIERLPTPLAEVNPHYHFPSNNKGSRLLGNINVPSTSGQVLKGIAEKLDPGIKKIPPSSHNTLNRMVLHHEAGERNMYMSRNPITPFSGHLGIEPILQEKQHAYGDPDAAKIMKTLRTTSPDDVHAEAAIRRVGGTFGAPVPIGGKQHRALNEMMTQYTPASFNNRRNEVAQHVTDELHSTRLRGMLSPSNKPSKRTLDLLKYVVLGRR